MLVLFSPRLWKQLFSYHAKTFSMDRLVSNTTETRVLLVDCTRMAAQLLAGAIAHDSRIKVLGAVTSSAEAWDILKNEAADVVLLSDRLNGDQTSGFQFARHLRATQRHLALVMLLDSLNSTSVVEAFRAGVNGVFTRDGSLEALHNCIFHVVRGETWANTEAVRFLIKALSCTTIRGIDPDRIALLTTREREVANLAADGVKNRDIAQKLGISWHTVKNYLFSIFKKLGVKSRVELSLSLQQERIGTQELASSCNQKPHAAAETIEWLRSLADAGVVHAQHLLAEMYREGLGISRNPREAYHLLSLPETKIKGISGTGGKKVAV